MQKPLEYHNCFVCGKDSKNGLKVNFEITESGARASYTPGPEFEGFKGVVHGGILSSLLDEIMWKSINGLTGAITMTAKMEVRFKKPALMGTPLIIEGFILNRKRKFFETRAIITTKAGDILAEATGLFMELNEQQSSAMTENLS